MAEKVYEKEHTGTFPKRCKHFAGIDFTDPEKRCDAGVRLRDVFVDGGYKYRYRQQDSPIFRASYSSPCFRDSDPLGVCCCHLQEFPTDEEVEENNQRMAGVLDAVMLARLAIIEAAEGKRGVTGTIPCEVCKSGELFYSVSEFNGHVWAKCSTENCVAWME